MGVAKSQDQLASSLNNTLTNTNEELPNYKKISTLVVIKEPWSVDNNCLTPTLKVKRNVVNQKYQDHLMAWHCLLYTSPSPRDATLSRMPSSA